MTYAEWTAAAQRHAERLGLPPDLWADSDPYDLAEAAASAFTDGVDPKKFIEEAFEEDLARMAGDAQDLADSMQAFDDAPDGDES